MAALVTFLVLGLAFVGLYLATDAAGGPLGTPDALYLGAGLLIATLTFSTLVTGRNSGAFKAARDLMAWAAMFAAMVTGYSYREELHTLANRVAAELAPPGNAFRTDTQAVGEQAVRIRRRPDGHFIARTELNGITLPMLVDTGASTVVVRPADAQKLGIDVEKLRYSVAVQTANGTTYAAPVKLKRVTVGPITFMDVDALVSKPGALRDSLLGMSFLNRLRSYEFSGDFLTLKI